MSPTILVVEDEPSILELLRINLVDAGYDVRAAPDAESGQAMLRERLPDLLLLDWMLPGKSGLARLPDGVNFRQVYGAAILCGIGFTMSMFIGMLAFENTASGEVIITDQLGILAGTLLSAMFGSLVLYFVLPRAQARNR